VGFNKPRKSIFPDQFQTASHFKKQRQNGLGTTAMAKEILRRRLLKKVEESLKERSLPELLEMSSAERNG